MFAARRAYDFICLAIAEENLDVKIACALPGLTTGYGPSHQATEDLAIFRGMPNLTIIDPCDALDIEQAVPAIAAHQGPVYMRLLRGNVPLVLDEYDYKFELGKAKLLRDGGDALIIASGLMTMRALEVARPRDDRIDVAVLHVPTIKPLDEATILREASTTAAGSSSWPKTTRSSAASARRSPGLLLRDGVTPGALPPDRAARRVPRCRRPADAARPLRHLDRGDGAEHQVVAGRMNTVGFIGLGAMGLPMATQPSRRRGFAGARLRHAARGARLRWPRPADGGREPGTAALRAPTRCS